MTRIANRIKLFQHPLSMAVTAALWLIVACSAIAQTVTLELSDLDGNNGFAMHGVGLQDQAGRAVNSVGDINNDNIDDIAVCAPIAAPPGATEVGQCYVVFGSSNGFSAVLELSDLDGNNGFTITGNANEEQIGRAISRAGDFNNDGIDDLIIGAPIGNRATGPNGGIVVSGEGFVVFGRSTAFPANINLGALNGSNGFSIQPEAQTLLGISVGAAGDFNGDGVDDLLIGGSTFDIRTPGNPTIGNVGATYVVFGFSNANAIPPALSLSNLSGIGVRFVGIDAFDLSGGSVSGVGDVNGDNIDDIIIGASQFVPTNTDRSGEAYVVYGNTSLPTTMSLSDLDGSNGFVLNGVQTGDHAGSSVSGAGDINGDGRADLLIGADHQNINEGFLGGANNDGAAYVVFGRDSFPASFELADLNGTNGFSMTGRDGGDFFGISVSGVGDANGDGFDDVLVGAEGGDPNGNAAGESYLILGRNTGFPADLSLSSGSGVTVINGVDGGDLSGADVAAAGDLNNDGRADLLIGAERADPGGALTGAAYVVFGDPMIGVFNSTPENTVPPAQNTNEDIALQFNGNLAVMDADNDSLTTVVSVDNGVLTASTGGSAVITGNGTASVTIDGIPAAINNALNGLTYFAGPDVNGNAMLTISSTDDNLANDTDMVAITIAAVNDAPTFMLGGDQTILEDSGAQTVAGFATSISAGPPDESGQNLSFNVSNDNPGLFASEPQMSPDGTLTYTAAPDANGSAVVTVSLMDDGGVANGGVDVSLPQNFNINVTPVNDVPVFMAGADQTSLEDSGAQTVTGFATGISAGPADESGQTLSFNVGNDNPGLFASAPQISPDGTLDYTAEPDANGSALVTVSLMDDGGVANGGVDVSQPQTFNINVTSVNDVPLFTVGPDQMVFDNVGPQTISPWATGISAGPADESGQSLTFNITGNSNPEIFAVPPSVAPDGTLSFTPAMDANISSTISLNIMDDGGTANGGIDTSTAQSFDIRVVATNADLALSISNTAMAPVELGDSYRYVIDLINNGPGDAVNSIVTIEVPNGLAVTMPGCFNDGGNGIITWQAGLLNVGESAQCEFEVQVLFTGQIIVSGNAQSDLNDPIPENNTAITSVVMIEPLIVPALNNWAMIILAGLLGWLGMRRRMNWKG